MRETRRRNDGQRKQAQRCIQFKGAQSTGPEHWLPHGEMGKWGNGKGKGKRGRVQLEKSAILQAQPFVNPSQCAAISGSMDAVTCNGAVLVAICWPVSEGAIQPVLQLRVPCDW